MNNNHSYANAVPVTSSNTAVTSQALYIGGAGNLTVTMETGNQVTFSNVAAGTLLPIRVSAIANSTTATNILALR